MSLRPTARPTSQVRPQPAARPVFSLPRRKPLRFQPLADVPPAQRLEAARELVASDPNMPAYQRQELLELAFDPPAQAGAWIEDEPE